MQILPPTIQAWSRVALLPFKVYVLSAYFALQVYLAALPRGRDYESELFLFAIFGYLVCFIVLCCENRVRNQTGRPRDSLVSLLFAFLAAIFGYLLLPWLSL